VVRLEDIHAAAERIAPYAHRTPVATSRLLDEACGGTVFLKCENLQRAGAFKFRGACNAVSLLGGPEKARGVIAFSSGNHAQALALVGRLLGVRATVVMPRDAPVLKRSATEAYGAEVILYDPASGEREAIARRLASERGFTLVPPFDHPDIIAGQGTAALELLRETGPLDCLLAPCGGGGLLSGCGVAARALSHGCKVIGVEPEAGDDAVRSFRSGTLAHAHNPQTIADGARTPSLGQHTFPMIRELVDDMLAVSDDDLIRTMHFVWTRLKLVVEPTGVLGLAALFCGRMPLAGKRAGVILSGGNVDVAAAARWFQSLNL